MGDATRDPLGDYEWRVLSADGEHVAEVPDQIHADAAALAFDVSHPDDAPHCVQARFVELWVVVE